MPRRVGRAIPSTGVEGYGEWTRHQRPYARTPQGNHCELVGYADKEHNFYSSTGPDRESYRDTLRRTHLFLKDLGYLTSDPRICCRPSRGFRGL